MASVDTRSISQKLIRLEEVIAELSAIRETSREAFLHDRRLQAATERYFILGIEIITDIGNHLLVETAHQATTSYEDIIVQLGTHRIVPAEVATRNAGMAKFRNRLVHVYDTTDPALVFEFLTKAPEEFRAFAQAFAVFL